MQLFACDNCQAPVFFDNFQCMSCGHRLAFLPELRKMSALEQVEPGATAAPSEADASEADASEADASAAAAATPQPRYRALGASGKLYRMCKNHEDHAACSWAVPDEDPEPLCLACRLNAVIPDLTKPEQREAWLQLEGAKRRLLYSLFLLELPVESQAERPEGGLAFSFMAGEKEQPVFTGHSDGLITINVAEASDPFREKIRAQLGEAYRTVLGHFRHEIGHYYWDRLIKSSAWLPRFRELFGDESVDYSEELKRHYEEGPPKDWAQRFVSQYASMHPWEDWAETWAHYLHIFDTLETAKAYGLRVVVGRGTSAGEKVVNADEVSVNDFDQMAADWVPLTVALNSLNRSMGMRDLYPFVLTETALNKLRFVHEVIKAAGREQQSTLGAAAQPSQPAESAETGVSAMLPAKPQGKGLRERLWRGAEKRTG